MWKILILAFRDNEGYIVTLKFVVMVVNDSQLLITEDTIISVDTVGADRAEFHGWEYVGCRLDNLRMEDKDD